MDRNHSGIRRLELLFDRWKAATAPLSASPAPAWTLASLNAAAIPFAGVKSHALSSPVSLAWYAAMFSLAGYAAHKGDHVNGSGIATAWSLVYLFMHGRSTLRTLRPAPLILAAGALGNIGIYGPEAINSWLG